VQSLCEPCPYCDGNANVKARDTVIMEIYRELQRELPLRKKKASLYVSASIAERLKEDPAPIADIEKKTGREVVVKPVDRFHQERFEII